MTQEEVDKKLSSLIGSLKGSVKKNINPEYYEIFLNWCNKLLVDTIKDKKEKEILSILKTEKNKDKIIKLKTEKKKYFPKNYPKEINIGDVVHINFGYGYCSEISDGHYGIIMSSMIANMYFAIPVSSEVLRKIPFPIKLGVPNKENDTEKISYLRFDQMRMIHYRRIENVIYGHKFNIGEYNILEIHKILKTFFQL